MPKIRHFRGLPIEQITHTQLSDMPSATNSDHDIRYATRAELASTVAPSGASLIGVEDAGGFFAGTDVEAVLQEIMAVVLPGAYLRLDGTNVPTANYNWVTNLTTIGTLQGGTITDGVISFTGGVGTGLVSLTDGVASWAGNSLTGFVNITATGTITGGTLTDGVFSITGGVGTGLVSLTDGVASWAGNSLTGFVNITATGTIQGGTITDGTISFTGGVGTGLVSLTDGVASWAGNSLAGFVNITATGIIQGGTLTDGTFSITGGVGTGLVSLTDGTASWVGGNLSGFGTIQANTSVTASTLTIAGGSITDTTGAISFGNENLTTSGTGNFGVLIVDTNTLVANLIGYINKVGVNTVTPQTALNVHGTSFFSATDATIPPVLLTGSYDSFVAYHDQAGLRIASNRASSSSAGAGIIGYSFDGVVMGSGHRLAFFLFGGSTGANTLAHGAGMVAYADALWTLTSAPTRLIFEVAKVGAVSRSAAMTIKSNLRVGIGTITPDARVEIETISTEGTQALTIDQNDQDKAFIDFQGTYSGDFTKNISSAQGTGAIIGPQIPVGSGNRGWNWGCRMVLMEVNGCDFWFATYREVTLP